MTRVVAGAGPIFRANRLASVPLSNFFFRELAMAT
jgi:hypothetical protein